MKLLLGLLFFVSLIPFAFADHITNGTSGVGYDDTWYIKEIDNTVGECVGYNTNSPSFSQYSESIVGQGLNIGDQNDDVEELQDCGIFFTWEKADISGKQMRWFGQDSRANSCCPTYIRLYDGGYNANSTSDFGTNTGITTKGAGLLVSYGDGTFGAFGNDGDWNRSFTPDLSSSTESKITGFYILEDGSQASMSWGGIQAVCIDDIEVPGFSEKNCWTFSAYFTGSGVAPWNIVNQQSGTQLDWWTVLSYNPAIPNEVSGLTATALNSTAIKLDWTDATATKQQHTTPSGYNILYKEGKNNESYYWKGIGNVGQGVETYTWNGGTQGHDYTFKLITYAYDMMSNGSLEVTATTTGTPSVTQTFDVLKETYASIGIEDNAWHTRDYSFQYADGNVDFSNQWRQFGCNVNQNTGTGWEIGTADNLNLDHACIGLMKVLPKDQVDGVTWVLTNFVTHDHASNVDAEQQIWDGALDVYDSTHFKHNENFQFAVSADRTDYTWIDAVGAGLLWSNCSGTTTCSTTFTPDLSSATSDDVTYLWRLTDERQNEHVTVKWTKLDIDNGKIVFQAPLTSTERTEHPLEGIITGTTHDIWRLIFNTPPKTPTLDSGVKVNNTSSRIEWTNFYDGIGDDFYDDFQQHNILRQCSDQQSFSIVDNPSGLLINYTDTDFILPPTTPWSDLADFEDDFTTDKGWVSNDIVANGYFRVGDGVTPDGTFQYDIEADSSNDYAYYDFGTVLPDTWVMQFKISPTAIGNTAHNHGYFAISDTPTNNMGTGSQDFIGIKLRQTGTDGFFQTAEKDGATHANLSLMSELAGEWTVGNDYYVEVARHNATAFTVNVWKNGDGTYTGTPDFTGTRDLTGKTIDGLRYFKWGNWQFGNSEQSDIGTMDDLKLWQNIDDVPETPRENETRIWCDYKITNQNYIGTSLESNTIRILTGLGSNDLCSNISTTSFDYSWDPTYSGDKLQGYGVQISEDDVTFTNVIESTFSTNPSWKVDGLEENTDYYVQWRNVFFNGTYGDWSSSIQCTTLLGGGGGPDPDPDPEPCENITCIIPCVDLNLNGICDDEEGCVDINNNGVCDYLEDPFLGIDLEAPPKTMSVGETKDGNLIVHWRGTDPLTITGIDLNTSDTGLSLAFATPITFNPEPSGVTSSLIPYEITSAPEECITLQTPNCVFVDATYEVPIEITAIDNLGQLKAGAILEVDIVSGFEVAQLMALGLGVLAFAGIVARRREKKKHQKWKRRQKAIRK